MGRDWYWGGGSGSTKRAKSGGGGGGGGGEREIGTTTTTSTTPSGCMSAVFQFFDFHHFQLCLNQHQPPFKPHSFLPDDPIVVLKGVEAPRNSLETDQEEAFMADNNTSLSAAIEKEENLTMPMGIQIKTSGNGETRSSSAESSFSPGAKTPNLVARLMGLDILPDCHSPASSISSFHGRQGNPNSLKKHHMNHQSRTTSRRNYTGNDVIGTRSLPETPRISSARRSDVEHYHHHHHHHRLSLQINKDQIANINDQDLELYSNYSPMAKRKDFKLATNNDYARQIVKQVKESVGRRVGLLDITNTLVKNNNRSSEEMMIRKDEHLMKIKSKIRSSTKSDGHDLMISQNKSTLTTPTSSSPRLRFFQAKDQTVCGPCPKPPSSPSPLPSSSSSSLSSLVDNQSNSGKVLQKPKIHQQKQEQKSVEKISSRSKKVIDNSNKTNRKKREEPFVCPSTALRANNSERKSKKTLLSNELGPNLLPVKKDPSPPATKLPQKQVPCAQASKRGSQLSSSSSQLTTYKQETTQPPTARENIAPAATARSGGGAEVLPYVTKILKRTGIDKDTLVSFSRWFSPSHPLDPSIFTHLEPTFFTTTTTAAAASDPFGQLRHRGNRRLIFHLVDEILVDILKPYLNMKPWARCGPTLHDQNIKGSELIEKLCEKIGSFPSANCEVLEDIDALIDADLKERTMSFSSVAFEEEGEAIVLDIEKDMVDSVVQELVLLCGGFW